jgi:EthD domain
MEKVVYTLSRVAPSSRRSLGPQLRGEVAAALLDLGAAGVQVNVADDAVEPAAGLRITTSSQPLEAVVSVWLDSAVDHLREPFDRALAAVEATMAAYAVSESVPLRNTRCPAAPGARTDGFAQVALLQRPAALSQDDFLDLWLNGHTPVALGTQDTFGYVQNVVTRPLTAGAPPWVAIVEELFPAGAMTDPHVFYDAVGDDDLLRRNQRAMFASTQRFLDFSAIDVIPTSQYVVRAVAG